MYPSINKFNPHHRASEPKNYDVVAYVDGSYYPYGRNFAGAAVYFGENDGNERRWGGRCPNVEQYMPLNGIWGPRSAIRAEIYASLLAARQGINMGCKSMLIRQDSKGAKFLLNKITSSVQKTSRREPGKNIVADPLLYMWWKVVHYIQVKIEWIPAHTEMPKDQDSQEFGPWFGNYSADIMAKRAAKNTKYIRDCQEMDKINPFNFFVHTQHFLGLPLASLVPLMSPPDLRSWPMIPSIFPASSTSPSSSKTLLSSSRGTETLLSSSLGAETLLIPGAEERNTRLTIEEIKNLLDKINLFFNNISPGSLAPSPSSLPLSLPTKP